MKYYLYRHIRLDKNEVFYIGVGTKQKNCNTFSRAYDFKRRSSYWKNITSKTKYIIEILYESDDYKFILNKEKEFIKVYGRRDLGTGTLCNLTDGGEGTINILHSQLFKNNISIRFSKKIYIYKLDGTFLKSFNSLKEANKELNLSEGSRWHKSSIIYKNGFLLSQIDLGNTIESYKKYDYSDHKYKIKQCDKFGNLIKIHNSIKDAAKYIKSINSCGDISKCINGKRKSAKGFKWEYQL